MKKSKKFEIISLNGTVSINGIHLHASVSDNLGNVFGGHLMEGNIVFTTCELVLLELAEVVFTREEDPATGFKEIKFNLI